MSLREEVISLQVQSMTGYGRGIAGEFIVELRSSNHRSLDLQFNIPSYLLCYESEIRKLVRQRFHRGRIEIYVSKQEKNQTKLKVDKLLAREYYGALVSLKNELSLPGEVGIELLATQRDIFVLERPEIEPSSFYKAFNEALEALERMRIEEGRNLVKDISERIQLLNKYVIQIENKRKEFITKAKERLHEKLKDILKGTSIDETRLIQEVAILIEKSDITEEIVRIKTHLGHIEDVLRSGNSVGKKIDFLAQALHREINTISAKSPDVDITTYTVEMRYELEKIREQVQNLQ